MNRKRYSSEMKMQVVKEALETGNASIVARRHDIAPSLVARWVRYYKRYGAFRPPTGALRTKNSASNPQEHKKIVQENEQLKKLLGEKDLEIAILRDLLKKTSLPSPIK